MSKKTPTAKEPIYTFRVEAGKTLDEVANLYEVSTRTLIRWEQGAPRLPVNRLVEAERIYGRNRAEIRPDIFGAAQ